MAVPGAMFDVIGFKLADKELWMDASTSGVRYTVPPSYAQFIIAGKPQGGLTLQVCDGPARRTNNWRSLFYDAQTWQLWIDDAGRYVFVPPKHSPPERQVAVDTAFRAGEVIGQFSVPAAAGRAVYPLKDIDIIIVINWLAESGDLIVHAAGIDDYGAGYAFVGPAGAGKSTLVSELARTCHVTVLGEDQVILRYRAGRFWVYGTPWHTDPARCSPGGVPLEKLFFLDRTLEHRVEPCARMAGIARLMQDAFIPFYNRAGTERILETLARLLAQVPLYTLGFQVSADVMRLIRAA